MKLEDVKIGGWYKTTEGIVGQATGIDDNDPHVRLLLPGGGYPRWRSVNDLEETTDPTITPPDPGLDLEQRVKALETDLVDLRVWRRIHSELMASEHNTINRQLAAINRRMGEIETVIAEPEPSGDPKIGETVYIPVVFMGASGDNTCGDPMALVEIKECAETEYSRPVSHRFFVDANTIKRA